MFTDKNIDTDRMLFVQSSCACSRNLHLYTAAIIRCSPYIKAYTQSAHSNGITSTEQSVASTQEFQPVGGPPMHCQRTSDHPTFKVRDYVSALAT